MQKSIERYSEEFSRNGDIGLFIRRCRYLAGKSERPVEEEASEPEGEPEAEAEAEPEVEAEQEPEPAATPTRGTATAPSTPGTVPARRTRARRRLATEASAATQPVEDR